MRVAQKSDHGVNLHKKPRILSLTSSYFQLINALYHFQSNVLTNLVCTTVLPILAYLSSAFTLYNSVANPRLFVISIHESVLQHVDRV